MARTKKTASVTSTAPKTRGIDVQEVEARVTALDKAKRRSYDIFDIEQRVYNLEKNGSTPGPTPTNPGDLYIKDDVTNKMTYVINDDNASFYFNGFTKEAGDVNFPTDFNNVIPRAVTEMSKAYGPDKVTQIGWIGWHGGKIRAWSIDTKVTIAGTFWGVVNVGGGESQNNEYIDPPVRG